MMAASLAEGTAIGRYTIRSFLGAGGMGEVYLAWEASLERVVALKVLRPGAAADAHRLRRFITEARAASALNHPAIVTVYESGECVLDSAADTTVHYIAMERVEGVTLDEWARQKPSLPATLTVLAGVADGLGKAHARGIVHRDLKPDNIMITAEGQAKILDFGIAKLLDRETGEETGSRPVQQTLTECSALIGTAAYMSPEQVEGLPLDHRADIFAFGSVLYQCLTGRAPFAGATRAETLHQVVHGEVEPLVLGDDRTRAALQRILDRCLARDREHRYDSARDLALDLREAVRLLPEKPARRIGSLVRRLGRSRRSQVVLALLAAALLLPSGMLTGRDSEVQRMKGMVTDLKMSNQAASLALEAREKEIERRGVEIELLRAERDRSERLRADLETSYRTLLADVGSQLRRTDPEKSQLRQRVSAAEAELLSFREQQQKLAARQAAVETIRQRLAPTLETQVDTRGLLVRIPGELFERGSARLHPMAWHRLDEVARQLVGHPEIKVAIEGHTDPSGDAESNLELSQRRAEGVRDQLVTLGVDPMRLTAVGRGEAMPAFSNATGEGMIRNRRVDLILAY